MNREIAREREVTSGEYVRINRAAEYESVRLFDALRPYASALRVAACSDRSEFSRAGRFYCPE